LRMKHGGRYISRHSGLTLSIPLRMKRVIFRGDNLTKIITFNSFEDETIKPKLRLVRRMCLSIPLRMKHASEALLRAKEMDDFQFL